MELGSQKGSSHKLREQFKTLQEKKNIFISSWNEVTAITTQQEKKKIPPCPATAKPMRACHNSTNEKLLHFELPVSSNGLFVHNTKPLPNPLTHYKRKSPFSPELSVICHKLHFLALVNPF